MPNRSASRVLISALICAFLIPSGYGQQDMAVERRLVLLHLPKMDVMHVPDALDASHRLDDAIAQHQRPDRPPLSVT
jgi:hypothetical protein